MASNWQEWIIEESDSLNKIDKIILDGHTWHCACRQAWGDGYCECRKGLNEQRDSQG